MTIFEAFVLGVVEGLTEFLPVSSTGHLILTQDILGLGPEVERYLVTIQLGALFAVVLHYREQVLSLITGALGKDPAGRKLLLNLFIAFLPAAGMGLLFDDLIETYFFNPTTVAVALIVGGVIMIAAERHLIKKGAQVETLDAINWKSALTIGFGQCAALWPGMSRSMSTIVTAQLCGFNNRLAADFSFLLALPTLGAATTYSLLKGILKNEGTGVPITELPFWVGMFTAFIVAWAAIAGFLHFLKRVGMTPFGVYRIILGVVTLIWFWS